MKKFVRCAMCYGSGRVMGGGMIQQDCEECDGLGKIPIDAYNQAISEIKALDPNMNDERAKEIFNEEMKKIEKKEKRKNNGKP